MKFIDVKSDQEAKEFAGGFYDELTNKIKAIQQFHHEREIDLSEMVIYHPVTQLLEEGYNSERIGGGCEAVVYDIGTHVFKYYKTPFFDSTDPLEKEEFFKKENGFLDVVSAFDLSSIHDFGFGNKRHSIFIQEKFFSDVDSLRFNEGINKKIMSAPDSFKEIIKNWSEGSFQSRMVRLKEKLMKFLENNPDFSLHDFNENNICMAYDGEFYVHDLGCLVNHSVDENFNIAGVDPNSTNLNRVSRYSVEYDLSVSEMFKSSPIRV
jgi:hypothetical protein